MFFTFNVFDGERLKAGTKEPEVVVHSCNPSPWEPEVGCGDYNPSLGKLGDAVFFSSCLQSEKLQCGQQRLSNHLSNLRAATSSKAVDLW